MMEGPTHVEGRLNLEVVRQKMSCKEPGHIVTMAEAWKHDHRGKEKGQEWCSDSAKRKMDYYLELYRKTHGDTADPVLGQIDPVVVMKAGPEKRSGRHFIFNDAISTSSHPTLSEIRVQSTTSSVSIWSRPSPSASVIAKLQDELEEERKLRRKSEAARDAREQERSAREQ